MEQLGRSPLKNIRRERTAGPSREWVLQVRLNTKDKDQRVFDESTKHRRDFVISEMKGMINKLESTNPYKDFKKDEEKE